ncbi:MAG TPA: polysaccharide biosynthesis/export family protein [Alphaproteobacteria bacterium]|nr:polysaccharide biosynthesis/export family protein [Alphaproteobacteria bacterium]
MTPMKSSNAFCFVKRPVAKLPPWWRALAPAAGLVAVLALAGCGGGSSIQAETHSLKMVEAPQTESADAGSVTTNAPATSSAPAATETASTEGGAKTGSAETAASGAKPAAAGKSEAGAGKVTTEYKLGTGDQLQVAIFGQPDLSGKFEVDGNGNITLPLIGPLKAEGHTVAELQQSVTAAYDKSFLVNAKVSVQVLNYRPFYILGEIGKPGSYPYVSGLTMRQAVAIAGGYTRRARESPLEVVRSGQDSKETEDAMPDDPVLPGDTITVERRVF